MQTYEVTHKYGDKSEILTSSWGLPGEWYVDFERYARGETFAIYCQGECVGYHHAGTFVCHTDDYAAKEKIKRYAATARTEYLAYETRLKAERDAEHDREQQKQKDKIARIVNDAR